MPSFKFSASIRIHCWLLTLACLGSVDAGVEKRSLSYADALERVLSQHPALAENVARLESAEGQIHQAGRLPNPVLGTELANILGTGPMRGVQSLEFTLSLSQTIETAKKRQHRIELARAERNLLRYQHETLRIEIESRVRTAFTQALLAREQIQLRRQQLNLAEKSALETERLVQAARSLEVDAARAHLAVQQQRFALESAQREYLSAKTALAGLWSEVPLRENFEARGSLTIDPELPAYDTLLALLPESTTLAAFKAEHHLREAALELEIARAKPDLEVFAGGRYFNEADGEGAFILGLQIPWPLFDKNKGNIRSAQALRRASRQAEAQRQRELRLRLNHAYQNLATAHAESESITRDLLPAAEATLTRTQAAYQQGKFNQLTVLEAQQIFFDLRQSHLDALRRYHTAQTEIQNLTALRPIAP